MKNNDRLERVQIGREDILPLDSKDVWFLVIYKDGEWDSENRLDVFKLDLEQDKILQLFCVWHGTWRTNLFLMTKEFALKHLKDKEKEAPSKQKKAKKA